MIQSKNYTNEVPMKNAWLTGARVAIVIVLIALIRSIAEFFRLAYIHNNALTIEQIKPFMVGSIVAAVGCLAMTIFSFYAKNKIVIAISLFTIASMLLVKSIYHLS